MPISRRTGCLIKLACVVSPLALLVLAELALRIAGFGGYPSLFREFPTDTDDVLVATDRAGAASYFRHISHRLTPINQAVFAHPASTGTLRIVLAGGSAAKGFPQSPAFSAAAFLEAMLADAWPGREVEVLNLGTTAVASYPALDMARQALAYDPDLVIVFSGNNEFYGTYGVLSSPWAVLHPYALRIERWLRSLALLQATEPLFAPREALRDKTLMEIMFSAAGEISPARRAAAVRLIDYNLRHFAEICAARDIALIVCTLPANECDLAPIGGNAEALRAFQHGRDLLAAGRTNDARLAFARAVDTDTMPWRAPSAVQAAIRRVAASRNVPLCDLQQGFRAASTTGSTGWELMDDHVHPALAGQVLSARLLVHTMTQCTGRVHIPAARLEALQSDETYLAEAGANPYDRWLVATAMRNLFAIPFFVSNNPAAAARFDRQATRTSDMLGPAMRAALLQSIGTPAQAIGRKPVAGFAAHACLRAGDFTNALALLDVALRSTTAYSSWNLEYVYFTLVCRQRIHGRLDASDARMARAALRRGAFLLRHGFAETGVSERYMGRIHQLLGEQRDAIPLLQQAREKLTGIERAATDRALVSALLATGDTNAARVLVRRELSQPQALRPVYLNLLRTLRAMPANAAQRRDRSPASSRAGDDSRTVLTK